MKKLRVLALMHDYMVPPKDVSGFDLAAVEWKTEFDVTSTLSEMGHELKVLYHEYCSIKSRSSSINP